MDQNLLLSVMNTCSESINIDRVIQLLANHDNTAKLVLRIKYTLKRGDTFDDIKKASIPCLINELKQTTNISDFSIIIEEYKNLGIENVSCTSVLDTLCELFLIKSQNIAELNNIINLMANVGVLLAIKIKSDLQQNNIVTDITTYIFKLLRNSNIIEIYKFAYEQYANKADYDINELLDISDGNIIFNFIQTCIQIKSFNTSNYRINAFKTYYDVLELNEINNDDTYPGLHTLCNIVIDKRKNIFKITDMLFLLSKLIDTNSNLRFVVYHYLLRAYPDASDIINNLKNNQYQSVNDIDFGTFYKKENHNYNTSPFYVLV